MLSENNEGLAYVFPLKTFDISCLMSLVRPSMTMLNNSGDSGHHPCLAPDFKGKAFSFFPIESDVSYGFLVNDLYYVEELPV